MKTAKYNKNIKDISFNSDDKKEIREEIMKHAGDGTSYLEFYGNGESYKLARKKKIKTLSIDDGRDLDNKILLQNQLRGKNKKLISLQELCNAKRKRTHNLVWLDYCGSFSEEVRKDIAVLPKVLENSGQLFFTFLACRENMYPKGTMREVIDLALEMLLVRFLKEAGLKTKITYKKVYWSQPDYLKRRKKGKTRMVVYGLEWKKL